MYISTSVGAYEPLAVREWVRGMKIYVSTSVGDDEPLAVREWVREMKIYITTSVGDYEPLAKFQEDDTQVWTINCQQRKEPLFSSKIHSGARKRPSPASVEWGGLRRNRPHRNKPLKWMG
ncbi:hypothetical protein AVEN_87162-1 [Araneus ventricosus]|uniref:Uncharacterized protein n=1 Tax=Araneus ventricosus TaxID=182803 RepID=A0A4Y2GYK9_ARAVE|nr:hypothetical protein AVEN_87162-1 [Araneus ventricosus]